jgi:hypothetical protein
MGACPATFGADGPPLQTIRSPSAILEEIINYAHLFQRPQLVPAHPLNQLTWGRPVVRHGDIRHATIWVQLSQFEIRVGDRGTFRTPTILLSFTAPATLFQIPVACGIHIPFSMWHNGLAAIRGPEFPSDRREPGFQIGVQEVRHAILSHLLARWRVLHERMPQPARNSLFGQILVRQYVNLPKKADSCAAVRECASHTTNESQTKLIYS